MQVLDPGRASYGIGNYMFAISQLAQTTLRSVLGQHELDEMLAERDTLNKDIQAILDRQTDAWGIKVSNVEIKHVDLNDSMIRAMARQAEAERSRRAKVIHATGEQEAAEKLSQAAQQLSSQPQALRPAVRESALVARAGWLCFAPIRRRLHRRRSRGA